MAFHRGPEPRPFVSLVTGFSLGHVGPLRYERRELQACAGELQGSGQGAIEGRMGAACSAASGCGFGST